MEALIVTGIVGAAIGYVASTFYKSSKKFKEPESGGCGGNCGCCSAGHHAKATEKKNDSGT